MASVTASQLVGYMLDRDLVNQLGLISLLGADRHRITLNTLELAIVRDGVLNQEALLKIKGDMSGLPVYDGTQAPVASYIDSKTSARFGALTVEHSPPAVVFVEDTEANRAGVAEALGTSDFTVWLTTASHFAQLRAVAYSDRDLINKPVCPDLFAVLDEAIRKNASDVHIKVGIPPRLRVDGYIRELPYQPLDRGWVYRQVEAISEKRHLKELEETFSCDLAYTFGSSRFRVNVAMDAQGHTIALRKLPSTIPDPKDILLPASVHDFVHLERGMVLVTGPTGSGKSTTLAALLHDIIINSERHVITLEDPIEFRFPTFKKAHVNQRELGQSFSSFSEGLRDALRQDPDVVLVGELRDSDTIATAITAAETGHLVFGTLHTYDAASTIARLVNSFPANEQDAVRMQLSQLLKGVVSQTLLPRSGGKGRLAAYEVMINNHAIASNLRKVGGHNQIKQTMQSSLKVGMCTMESSLAKLVVTGQVPREEAEFRARDRDEYKRMLDYYASQAKHASGEDKPLTA